MSSSTVDAEVNEEPAPVPRAVPIPHALPGSRAVATPLRSTNPSLTAVAGAGSATAVGHVRELGRRVIDQVVYGLRRLGSTTLVGIAMLVAAVTVFISYNMPQSAAVSALQSEIAHAPKLPTTAAPTGVALASLPPRSEAPDVVAKIYEEAKAAGLELPRGQYEYIPPRDGVAARYRLTFPVHASYPQIRGFLDRTLIALPAVAVEGLRIERKSVSDGTVDAEVKFAAYVRGEP